MQTRKSVTVAGMADLQTNMTASQWLIAALVAVWNWILATCTGLVGDLIEWSLAARTEEHQFRRSRTVGDWLLLRMARFLALVLATVEVSSTSLGAFKDARPFLHKFFSIVAIIGPFTVFFVRSVSAHHRLLFLAAITAGFDEYFTGAAKSFVTRTLAKVFTARHQLSTYLAAAEPVLVVGVEALLSFGFFSAKA